MTTLNIRYTKKPIEIFIPKTSKIENEAFHPVDDMQVVYEFQSRDNVYILYKDYTPKSNDILLIIGKGPFWRLQLKYHEDYPERGENFHFYEYIFSQTNYDMRMLINQKPI